MISHRQMELALKKQRLQYRCAEQRRELARGLAPLLPVFALAETVRSAARWIQGHPAISAGVLVALCAARPHAAARWARRAWLAWQAWRRLRLATGTSRPPQVG